MIENNYNLYNDGVIADKAVVKKSYSTPQIQVLVAKRKSLARTLCNMSQLVVITVSRETIILLVLQWRSMLNCDKIDCIFKGICDIIRPYHLPSVTNILCLNRLW